MKKSGCVLISLISLVLGISQAVLIGCAARHDGEDIRIASQPTAFSLPVFVAVARGYLQDQGFIPKVISFNSQSAATTALLSGSVDVSQLGTTVFNLQASSPGRIHLIYGQYSGGVCLVVTASSSTKSLSDLRGKRIGTWPSTTPTAYLHLLLDDRIGRDSFTVVHLDSRFLNQALQRKDVDVLFESDVYAQQAVYSGVGRYLSRSVMKEYVQPRFFNGGGIVLASWAHKNGDSLERIQRAFSKAIDYIHSQPDGARMILAKQLGVSDPVALQAPLDEFVRLDQIDKGAVQDTANKLQHAGLLAARINVGGLF